MLNISNDTAFKKAHIAARQIVPEQASVVFSSGAKYYRVLTPNTVHFTSLSKGTEFTEALKAGSANLSIGLTSDWPTFPAKV